MPIFEYKCRQCGHVMEVLQKSRKATRQTCEGCGSSDVQKLMSGFAVGQSKPAAPACDSCQASSMCGGDGCSGGMCSMG